MWRIPVEYSTFWILLFLPSMAGVLYIVGRKLIDYYFEKKKT